MKKENKNITASEHVASPITDKKQWLFVVLYAIFSFRYLKGKEISKILIHCFNKNGRLIIALHSKFIIIL